MTNDAQSYDPRILRKLLREAFNHVELLDLVSDDENFEHQEGNLVEHFSRADSIVEMAQETVAWCQRHSCIPYLVKRVQDVRPEKYEEFAAKLVVSSEPEVPMASGELEALTDSDEAEAQTPSPPSKEPRSGPIQMLQGRWPWIAVGLALVLIVTAIIVWLLFFQRGSLQVTKAVELGETIGKMTMPDFTICIQGPSHPTTPDCKVFNETNGWKQIWAKLMPGSYDVTEMPLGDNWSVTGLPATITVHSGDNPEQAQVTVTNTFQSGSMQVTKVVDRGEPGGAVTVADFEICVKGPSYPSGDCKVFSGKNGWKQTWAKLIPGSYDVTEKALGDNWSVMGVPATVTVHPDDDLEQAQVTVTNTFKPGDLTVDKVIEWSGVTPVAPYTDPMFEICIAGPSYPSGDCQEFSKASPSYTWYDLIPGGYTVEETTPSGMWEGLWTVSGSGVGVTVDPDGMASHTVTSTLRPGDLTVDELIEWSGVTPVDPYIDPTFEICITGPSYPNDDCQEFSEATPSYTWENLIPGDYTVEETTPSDMWAGLWTVPGSGVDVTVDADGTASHTVTSTFVPGDLTVDKVIEWSGVTPVAPYTDPTFEIRITGPSYPSGDRQEFSEASPSYTWESLIPGHYTVEEAPSGMWAGLWTASGSGVDVTVDPAGAASHTATSTFKPGSLQVSVVDLGEMAGEVVHDFQICVEGPSYPVPTPNCKAFSYPKVLTQTWRSLIPGQYTVAEKDPDANWALTGVPIAVTVNPGDDPLQVTATRTSQDLSAPIPPLPGAFEYLFGYPYSRELFVYHTSGIPGDPNWRETSLWWPCEFDGSSTRTVGARGLWCDPGQTRVLKLGVYKGDSLLDILWPAESESSLFALRPGMAYEVAFVPVRPGPFGIVISDTARGVRHRFMYAPHRNNTWKVKLQEMSGTTHLSEKDLQLIKGDYSHPYRLRIELPFSGEPVFKWMEGGAASAEWKTLPVEVPFEAGDWYRLGLIIGEPVGPDYSSIVIKEAKLEWSSLKMADSPNDQPPKIVDDTCNEFGNDNCGEFKVYGSQLREAVFFTDTIAYDGDMHYCKNPSLEERYPELNYAEWRPALEIAGFYDVAVHIPSKYSGNQTAVYEIVHARGAVKVPVDQQIYHNEWVYLGTFFFEGDPKECVRLVALTPADVKKAPTTGFDAVKWSLR